MPERIRLRMIELLPRLRRFALALTADRERADDLVQEACVRALANVDQWKPDTRLDSWMYRIVQNVWYDQRRTRKNRGIDVEINEIAELPGADGREVTESRLTLEQVSRKIAELPQDQQILMILVCIDGLSYREAAEALGVPIGTVMSRLARARGALTASLEIADHAEPSMKPRYGDARNNK